MEEDSPYPIKVQLKHPLSSVQKMGSSVTITRPNAAQNTINIEGAQYLIFRGLEIILDNCIEVANTDQRDSNNNGFGNVCDADLDNNGLVSFNDLNLFRSAFDSDNADADFDDSGRVSFGDLNIFRRLFDKPQG